ncbi:MAG: hypothetical protein B7X04_00780 [Parcubacteria group bacterium 21-54-25]|nr:MAG: hypothetical protein B7X04_00780 [Parcubacteria group bacterium 21-54-25]HQU07955.1 penicillin-binding transpeptidase domain-containing protein [Candidatus Paceibacterota bacterium]
MKIFRRKRNQKDREIAPEEIFLDSANQSQFDRAQFEGRLEKPISRRTFRWLFVSFGLICVALLAQAGKLELIHGAAYAAESAANSLRATTLFAPRGIITDLHGNVLAYNVEKADGSVRRYYTIPAMGQIIGYVSYPKKDAQGQYYDTVENGLSGLEAEYNAELSGTNGELLTETDALGHVRSQGVIIQPKEGKTLVLSIDASVEQALANALADVAKRNNFLGGAGVIMDVHTGAIRAIASYPSYDPNVMSNGGPANIIAGYNTDPGRPFLDRAIQGLYAPGSIVKPYIAAGALTDGVITPNTVIDDTGALRVPDPYHPGHSFVYTGWRALGPVDVRKAIAWSSDIFFYTVGGGFGNQKGLGIDRLDYWYHQFGLNKPTGVDLPGEAAGLIPSPAWKEQALHTPWYLGDTYFTAIGQYATQVTPIQMVRAIAAVANDGKLLTPTLLANQTPSYTTIPVSPATFTVVHEGMREGVTSALAHNLDVPYISVAAKTGTAQVGVNNQYDNAWVEGFFPYDHPQYAFAVVLGRGPSGLGEKAVTVMREFLDTLHAQNAPIVGGTATTTSTALVFGTTTPS